MAYLLSYALPVSLFYALSKNAKRHPMNLQLKMPEHKTLKKYVAVLLSGLAVVTATAVVNSLIFPVSFRGNAGFCSSFHNAYSQLFLTTLIRRVFSVDSLLNSFSHFFFRYNEISAALHTSISNLTKYTLLSVKNK
jgi:hypothetical protein